MRRGDVVKAVVAAGMLILAGTCAKAETGWGYYGGDEGGQRFSSASQITPANVTELKQAWSFSTRDMVTKAAAMKRASFENTPILADGRLYVCSPFNEVSALDPGTGKQLWRFDPKLNINLRYPNDYICRGVAYAPTPGIKGMCANRIFMNTADRRLIALDAASGKPCPGFGSNGTVIIPPGQQLDGPHFGRIHTTSAPVVTHGVVIVGSSIDDNQKVDELRGTVHAFDAVTGALKWSFDPLADQKPPFRAGAANVWAPMSVDEAQGLVILPVSSASTDFWGGLRAGSGKYANSIVALHVSDGSVAWSFQTTHHDVWDYDIPAQPTLGMVTYKGKTVPAVLQPTKQGLLFTIDRTNGGPLIPVVERKVPQGGAPGEKLSPTQPIPVAPAPLAANHIAPSDAFGLTFWDRGKCRDLIAAARHDGLYTPPSLKGTIIYPFTGGGTNWGGLAFDQAHDIVYVNTSNAMHLVKLILQKDFSTAREKLVGKEVSPNEGAPFGMMRETILSPIGMPCNPPPWGQLHAIDMHTGKILWSVPLGTTVDMAPFSEYILGKTGTPNLGGPMATASGLVFIGAAMDNYIRAFDARTGKELWRGRLPAGGQATPMTYMWKGKQYVVIAAGGHSKLDTKRGDQVIAYALPN
ncbi:MAG TPA: pyrroloquinoline quinone-dependent dehydrogenase [Rhizomicrobium sp.]|jgi:quinoprotein glucose dehydrogenase